jgi:hypothetical protein
MKRRVPDIYGNQPTRDSRPLKRAGDSSGKEWLYNQGTLYVKRRMTECAVMSCVLLNVEGADDEVNNRFEEAQCAVATPSRSVPSKSSPASRRKACQYHWKDMFSCNIPVQISVHWSR